MLLRPQTNTDNQPQSHSYFTTDANGGFANVLIHLTFTVGFVSLNPQLTQKLTIIHYTRGSPLVLLHYTDTYFLTAFDLDDIKQLMLEQIRQKLLRSEYIITKHAQRRCDTRTISIEEVKHVIHTGEVIENYPSDKPYPSCLILGYVRKNAPLYVLCALGEFVHIITVHWLDPAKWLDPKTRREKRT